MIRSAKHLRGFDLLSTTGSIGSVQDVYFDDERWVVRYLVVDTGTWLPGRHVLISPMSVVSTEWGEQRLQLSITRKQVENSPGMDSHKPVSRRQEFDYLNYYGYPHYWGQIDIWGASARPMLPPPEEMARYRTIAEEERQRAEQQGDTHLRSMREVTDYVIRATDGDLGHIDDFLIDDVSWAVRYLVLDTSNWWFGKHVLVSPGWIKDINWSDRTVSVNVTRQSLKNAPSYDRAEHVDRQWEAAYYAHLDQPGYWLDADEARATAEAQSYLADDAVAEHAEEGRHSRDRLERRSRPR